MNANSHHPISLPCELSNASGLRVSLNANGSIRNFTHGDVTLNLFVGNTLEGGPTNLWLRRHREGAIEAVPLLGPASPLSFLSYADRCEAFGEWQGLKIRLQLRLAATAAVWFWHVQVDNCEQQEITIDLLLMHDVALSAYSAIRLNEYYVSHYLDLTPLQHPRHGWVLAARQNLAIADQHPWAIIGSLCQASAFATDGLQTHGLAVRSGELPLGVAGGLSGKRKQHEHAMLALQDAAITLPAGTSAALGFFGCVLSNHAAATSLADLDHVEFALALPEAAPMVSIAASVTENSASPKQHRSLFSHAPILPTLDFTVTDLDARIARDRRHCEFLNDELLSFYHAADAHVVLRAKERLIQRPHGHMLRTGTHLVADETALMTTVWMTGVFNSMLTQGHVSKNRFLSTTHSWLGLFRSHGQRIFVELDGEWQQLGMPSAFEMTPNACRWWYKYKGHKTGMIEVSCRADSTAHSLALFVRVLAGAPLRMLVSHHIALGGDDGSAPTDLKYDVAGDQVIVHVPAASDLGAVFPTGCFVIAATHGSHFDRVGGDEILFADGASRGEPFICIITAALTAFSLQIVGQLVVAAPAPTAALTLPVWVAPESSVLAHEVAELAEIAPWYLHNALVHYLSPRGLEQYSGGGWGTRDVCQGPLEMLLALGNHHAVRDLLLKVFAAQNSDGDWPQWFMFFARERDTRAQDSHGDIVFWPLLALARYLLASEDAALLDETLPFFPDEPATLWLHIDRALGVIRARRIDHTHLAAYGHGDWNDSLQPANPALRERMCSAWTVTLSYQTLSTLARALRCIGHEVRATALDTEAGLILADFHRDLIVDEALTGYALFAVGEPTQLLLHPNDTLTGVRYSLLPMVHAILNDMLTLEQAHAHLALIDAELTGADGVRLFDRPLAYAGGPVHLFQRAESSAFFGREIGLMYTHAHLRYAEMLAHLGLADAFFAALCKSHPIGFSARVPSANLRQANCYFSSSDAAFADRYEALAHYQQTADGGVAFDGGWRIYSSGPGIALGLLVTNFLGIRQEKSTLIIDPVLPLALNGLRARLMIAGHPVEVVYVLASRSAGPSQIELNGVSLAFTRGGNRYRLGAAEVSMALVAEHISAVKNSMTIYLI